MADRAELVEATLEVYPEGLALVDLEERLVLWNRAAELLTGYTGAQLMGRRLPGSLEVLLTSRPYEGDPEPRNGPQPGRGTLLHLQHANGRDLPALARRVVLRDGLGGRIGSAIAFHPADDNEALPHGETTGAVEIRASQAEMRDRLEAEFEAFHKEGLPLGVVWIVVDQAADMRKTHGARACEAMLESVERTMANALRPGEELGRWGDDEFLVLSDECNAELLANHAWVLAARARTAEFFWWGDRVALTVSMGVAEAEAGDTLGRLLERAQAAVHDSVNLGGNRVMPAQGRQACSPS